MRIVLLTTLAFSSFFGCQGDASAPPPPAAAQGASAPVDLTSPQGRALGAYEALRALLADDQTKGVADTARRLAQAAKDATAKAPPAQTAPLEAMAAQADKLAAMPEGDIEALRRQFGELSREVVGLIAAAPALKSGRHVFECPMAQGYQKWVQVASAIENPYMGKSMLACGAPTTF